MTSAHDYDYPLPRELIAERPLAERSDARLLVVDRSQSTLAHKHVRDLPAILAPGDCLVLNDTLVLPARLVGCSPPAKTSRSLGRGRATTCTCNC
jgi:S-adenosylmethionine:tRNA ribosyltransferase-isomerase